MAQIDASGLRFSFSALNAGSTAHTAVESSSSDHYTWVTAGAAPFFRITALSFDGGITVPALRGTIDTINVTNDTFDPGFSIENLDVTLASLISTSSPATHYEKFWETTLAGATTIVMPDTGFQFSVMGDFVTVATGQNLVGSADTFVGAKTFSTGVLVGDALFVETEATLTGGADTWNDVSNNYIIGDVGNAEAELNPSLGVINGGADTVNLIDAGFFPSLSIEYVIGDVLEIGQGGVVNGGVDTITLRNTAGSNSVIGDTQSNFLGETNGGADVILIETTIAGREFVFVQTVVGDDNVLDGQSQNGGGGPLLTSGDGGDDAITLNNVNATFVSGDFNQASNAIAIGGDDDIEYRSTFAQTTPSAGYQITSRVNFVTGDVGETSGGTAVTGGNDTITLVNVLVQDIEGFSGRVSGDALNSSGSGAFVGGNDTISVLFNRIDTAPASYVLAGDAVFSGASSLTGGDDTVALNIVAGQGTETNFLYGDAQTVSGTGPVVVNNGDDVVRITSNAFQAAALFGDGDQVTSTGALTLNDGDDAVTGGGGADTIFGDTAEALFDGALVQTGGDDTLDGRGGNDIIFGGFGIDTAVFSLNQAVHVNLNGIPSSGSGDLFEAIGQGNDQLVGIENVTGSALGDVIIGNNQFNIFTGLGGADRINGGGGQDTASYAGSNAGVVINLSTGIASGGHAAGDQLVSIERLIGSSFNDTLVGNGGINVLDGGLGADSMRGLGGNDFYYLDNAGDVVDEAFAGSSGTDNVFTSVSVNLSNAALFKGDIENVTVLAGAVGVNVVGNGIANTITGNSAANALAGGLGNDTLLGGGGVDSFLFNTTLGATNVDTLSDYAIDDRIDLDDAIFTLLTPLGTLTAAQFKNTAAGAIDGDDRVIYNSGTGALFYDTNGSGAGGATQFAQLVTGLAVTNADFLVV